ncbi:hypothetical protein, partial [Rhizobacter sp. Root29]|uniref:hypothetical protein n=1 Tax=Rhizobacter sp. Root29 TaxID=1736511 RepID=UPI001F334884
MALPQRFPTNSLAREPSGLPTMEPQSVVRWLRLCAIGTLRHVVTYGAVRISVCEAVELNWLLADS